MTPIKACLSNLTRVLGEADRPIPLHQPDFCANEWIYVKECIDTGWVSSVGSFVDSFEKKLAEFTEVPYAVAVVNGTCALHIALILAEVRRDYEVLIPSLTFVATANAVAYCGAIPHFVDSDLNNLGIDLAKLGQYLAENTFIQNDVCFNKHTGRIIKAIIPVHVFGHSVDMYALRAICNDYHITIVEDASESLGAYYKGKHTGHVGQTAVLSFNGNKIITTGGGGAILTSCQVLAKKAKHLTTTAKTPHPYEFHHDEIGYNYRLPNLNAALGCAQLEQLPKFIQYKRQLAQKYIDAFKDCTFATILQEQKETQSNYWLNALILNEPNREWIDELLQAAHAKKWGLRGLWTPLDRLPMYTSCPKMDMSNTNRLYDSVVSLPSSASLGRYNV